MQLSRCILPYITREAREFYPWLNLRKGYILGIQPENVTLIGFFIYQVEVTPCVKREPEPLAGLFR